jgi:hypothetical protein
MVFSFWAPSSGSPQGDADKTDVKSLDDPVDLTCDRAAAWPDWRNDYFDVYSRQSRTVPVNSKGKCSVLPVWAGGMKRHSTEFETANDSLHTFTQMDAHEIVVVRCPINFSPMHKTRRSSIDPFERKTVSEMRSPTFQGTFVAWLVLREEMRVIWAISDIS